MENIESKTFILKYPDRVWVSRLDFEDIETFYDTREDGLDYIKIHLNSKRLVYIPLGYAQTIANFMRWYDYHSKGFCTHGS